MLIGIMVETNGGCGKLISSERMSILLVGPRVEGRPEGMMSTGDITPYRCDEYGVHPQTGFDQHCVTRHKVIIEQSSTVYLLRPHTE